MENLTLSTKEIKAKIRNLDYIKLKSFGIAQENINTSRQSVLIAMTKDTYTPYIQKAVITLGI